MTNKILNNIIQRVDKNKAIGIIYNCPKPQQEIYKNNLFPKQKAIIINGRDAYTAPMLQFRLGNLFKMKDLTFSQVPALLDGRMIVIINADIIKPSYSRVINDFFKYKVPMIIFMNTDTAMKDFRNLGSYQQVLTIEQDFNSSNRN